MKTALITGASSGIGAAVARRLASDGFAVALVCHRHKAEADAIADGIRSSGGSAAVIVCDVAKTDEVASAVASAEAELGHIDVLVNAAGIASQKLFTDITDADFDAMISTDLTSVFSFCRAVLPGMIRRKSGRIINISSMWGEVGASCEVHYSAAKAGVIGLTKALAKEVGPSGITVNSVSPGVIRTPMLSCFTEADLASLAEETPLGRLGEPEDVAGAVAFLAGADASFITGQVLGVNGGFVI